jgi:hypothetical protein
MLSLACSIWYTSFIDEELTLFVVSVLYMLIGPLDHKYNGCWVLYLWL